MLNKFFLSFHTLKLSTLKNPTFDFNPNSGGFFQMQSIFLFKTTRSSNMLKFILISVVPAYIQYFAVSNRFYFVFYILLYHTSFLTGSGV